MDRCPHCGSTHGAENHFCPSTGQPIDLGPRLISQRLLERFRVVTILGEGPTGIVVEVEETVTGERLAAKLIHPQFTRDQSSAEKLLSDAKRAGSLNCKHIAEVVEVGRDTGAALTVVRELMTGQCLETYLDERGQLPVDEAIKISREILIALDAIHSAGLLNLDLSPADVFLAESDDEKIIKLVDIGERHVKQELVFKDNEELESRKYYAPEQYDVSRQTNPRSDIYAAGAILYQMITGEIPPGDPKPASSLNKNVGNELSQVIRTALAATPGNRFKTATEFIAALDKVGTGTAQSGAEAQVASNPSSGEQSSKNASKVSDEPLDKGTSSTSGEFDSDLDEEQPSVIVDMTTMEKNFPFIYSTGFRLGAALTVVLAIVAAVIFSLSNGDDENAKPPEKIAIAVQIDPGSAAVIVDGKRIEGNPVTLEVFPDNKLHTVKAKAEGYEPLERDVKFDKSQTIKLALTEIIQPDEDISPPKELDVGQLETEKEIEAQPNAEVANPEVATPDLSKAEVPDIEDKADEPVEVSPPKILKTKKEKPKTRSRAVARKPKKLKKVPRKKPVTKTSRKPTKEEKTREGFSTSNPFD
ncbi:MAG: protein kinase [Proteobacteria bacterium]|nr:protein kinase [Pseudomonadota bacterium]